MAVRQKIEDQMRYDSKANGPTQYCASETLFDNQPGGKGSDDRRADGVREGHVREMYVGNTANRGFGSCSFHAEVVECDPGQLHGLDGDEERCHRDRRKAALD